MVASTNTASLELAFDVGHSSIGWAVLETNETAAIPDILGCGTVIFEKNSALANRRRLHRSQRRHVRATRQRIARMEKLLVHLGVFTAAELASKHQASGGHGAPWFLAARVLASNGQQTLSWTELWDVLRWYAHNRGYEEIGTEPREEEDLDEEQREDTEKVENAKAAMTAHGRSTMAETICAWLGLDPLGERQASNENYKGKNCAFERMVVVREVRRILTAHLGKLRSLDEAFIRTLLDDARVIGVPTIKLPKRYKGSLLFGRLETRFHNRIIGRCPISGEKIPNKNTAEFFRYRWAMQLANIRVGTSIDSSLRPLSVEERKSVHAAMTSSGHLGVRELKDSVRSLTGISRDNLEQLLLHPDAKEAFTFDPAQKLITSHPQLSVVWPHLPERLQKRWLGRWRHGKSTTLASLRNEAATLGHDLGAFDAALENSFTTPGKKSRSKNASLSREEILTAPLTIKGDLAKLSGRAPYARPLLKKAFEEVMAGLDPKGKGGCLEETPDVRRRRETRPLTEQTNNHLIRHRLEILKRLLRDIIADPAYGAGQPARISRVTLEVNRDLRDMSGLSAQDLAKELGKRLADHKRVASYLEEKLPPGTPISAGLIRKARIAHDLGWQCPYTGAQFEPMDLITRRVDKDHIIPHALRKSDSLDSLVVTFSAVNGMKRKRTALQFVTDEAGKPVPGMPNLSIMTPDRFEKLARAHAPKSDPRRLARARGERVNDDDLRCWRRMLMMMTKDYDEKGGGFTPGQLTQTSQLAHLAAQIIREPFASLEEPPEIVALPGQVTGATRKGWNLLGCLSAAAPGVLEADGSTKTKTEIRNITHLHHALDACVIGITTRLIPNRGDVWRLLAERRLNPNQQAQLAALGLFDFDAQGSFRLRDLPDTLKQQLRARLAERRVVQHVPADMNGLRIEENTRGVIKRENGRVTLRQQKRDDEGNRVINETIEPEGKVIGLPLLGQTGGKLAKLNGVRVIDSNFGVAILGDTTLPPTERFVIIPHERVWKRIEELKLRNGGKKPPIWRNGQIIELTNGKHPGPWRIFSVMASNDGAKLKLDRVDAVAYDDSKGASGWKSPVRSLLKVGARLLKAKFAG